MKLLFTDDGIVTKQKERKLEKYNNRLPIFNSLFQYELQNL